MLLHTLPLFLIVLSVASVLSGVDAACSCAYASGCSQDTSRGRCMRREDYSYSQRVSYTYYVSCGWWGRGRCGRTGYRYETRYSYRCNLYCCADYYQSGSSCIPRCSPSCTNGGYCSSPWTCTCPSTYTGGYCQTPVCSPGCQNGGTCSSPGVCTCTSEWTGSRCQTPVCTPPCQNGGTCSSPGVCSCDTTRWKGSRCEQPVCTPECQNGGTCSSPGVCTCAPGWEGSRCGIDIDECTRGTHACDQICYNNIGSYTCGCNAGYRLAPDGRTCTDINECYEIEPCDQTCTNTIGSFVCGCTTGWRLSGQTTCVDIDECSENNPCDHPEFCTNTIGSYQCGCRVGYDLSGRTTCIDVDECLRCERPRCKYPCDHKCTNNIGSFTCSCEVGYDLVQDITCVDINECNTGQYSCEEVCANNIGSYECACTPGNVLQADGLSCEKFNPFNPNPIVPGDSDFIGTIEDILECSPSSLCTCVQNSFNSLSSAGYGTVEGPYEISVFQNQSIAAGDFVLALFGSSAVFALPILANVEKMNFSCTSQTLDAHTFSTTAYHSLFLDLLNITDVSLTIGVHVSATGVLSYLKLLGVQGWGGLPFNIDVDLTDDNTWTFEANTAGDIDLVSFVNDAFNANFPSDPIKTTILLTGHKFNGIVDVAAGYEFYLVVRGTLQIGSWFQHDVCIVVHHILSGGQSPDVFIMTGYTASTTLSITLDSLISSLSGIDISRLTFFNNLNLDNYHLTFATPNFVISDGRLSQLDLPFVPSSIPNNLSGLEFVFDLSVPTLGAIQHWALSYSSSLNTAVLHPVSTVDDNVTLTDMFSFISNTLTVPTVPLVETDVTNFNVVEISLPFDNLESRVVISISHTIEIVENLILFASANITFPISLNGGVSLRPYIISGHFDIAQVGFSATIEYDGSSYQCRGKTEGFPSGVGGLLDIFIPGQTVRDIQAFFTDSSNSVGKRAAITSFGSSSLGITNILIKFLPQRYAEELCWDGTVYSGQYATVRGALCIFDLQDYTLGFDVTDFVVANFFHGVFGDPVYHVPFFNQKLDTILVYSSFDSGKLPWASPTYRYLEQRSLLKGVSFYSVSSWPDPCSTEFCIEARSLLGANAVFHLYTYIRSFDHLVLQAGLNDFMFGDFKVTNALLLVEFKKPNVFIGINGTIEIPDYSLRLDGAIQLKYPNLQIVADFTLNSTLPTCTDVTSVILDKPPSILKRVKIDFCYVYLYARLGQGISRPSANFGLVVGIGDRSCYRLELAAFAGMLNPKPTSSLNPTEFEDKYILAETHDKITLLSIIDMLFCTKLSGSLLSFFLDIGFTSGFTISISTVEYTVPQTGLYIRKGLYIRGSFMFLWYFHRYAELHFDPPDVIDIKVGLPPVNLAGGLIKLVESRTRDTIGPSVRFVLRNIPSFNFLLELSGYARLLGIAAEGKLSISHERCSMFIAGRIFGVLSVELTVYANYGSLLSADWGVQGVLQSNVLKAIEDAVVAVIKAAGDLAMKALAVPQEAVNRAQRAFDSAIGILRSAQGKVQNARNRVANERRKIGGWRRKLDSLCRYKRCRNVCIPFLCGCGCAKKVWGKCVWPCIRWSSCCFRIPDPICVVYNAVCFVLRLPFELLILAAQALLLIIEATLVVLELALKTAEIAAEAAKLVLEAAKVALDVVKWTVRFAIKALEAITRFLLTGIINITEIGFDVRLGVFSHGRISVHVDVSFFRSSPQRLQLTLPIFNPLAIVKDLVARAIPGLGRKKRSVERSIGKVYWLAEHFKQKGSIYPISSN